jgi:hypothetical protein
MRIQSGKHARELSEVLFLKQPDLAQWMIENVPDNALTKDFKRLRTIFNEKRLSAKKCYGCRKPATRASAYEKTPDLLYWCDKCDPYSSGARPGTLSTVDSFQSAMHHVEFTGGGNRNDKRKLVRSLASAKGLPKRITEAVALEFFEDAS